MFRKIDDSISVSPQIMVDDVARAAAMGFTTIVNNRPEGESFDQTEGDTIEAAARAAGLAYVAIPITPGRFGAGEIAAMHAALEEATGPVLAYCRTGTRSTLVWALARARAGDDVAQLAAKAAAVGYDISPILPLI